MAAKLYPTLHLTELHGVFAELPCAPPSAGRTGTGRFRIAVIGHPTQGHVALIFEDAEHKFVARLLNQNEASQYVEPLLASLGQNPAGPGSDSPVR